MKYLFKKTIFFGTVGFILCFFATNIKATATTLTKNDTGYFQIGLDSAAALQFTFNTPELSLQPSLGQTNFLAAALPDAQYPQPSGYPNLPAYSAWIALPPTGLPELVVADSKPAERSIDAPIEAVGAQQAAENDFMPGEVTFTPNQQIYKSTHAYPDLLARLGEPVWLRDQRLVLLQIFPVQYLAAEQRLLVYRQIAVTVTFNGGAAISGTTDSQDVLPVPILNRQRWLKPSTGSSLLQQTAPTPLRYRLPVSVDGLYRVFGSDLQAAGLALPLSVPYQFELQTQGQQVAIWVQDGGDNQFDVSDSLTFYGEKFKGVRLATLFNSEDDYWLNYRSYWPEYQLTAADTIDLAQHFEFYSDENVYWLTPGSASPSPIMAVLPTSQTGAVLATSYPATVRAEQQLVPWSHHFTSGDPWFWQSNNTSSGALTRQYPIELDGVLGTGTARLHAEVVARNIVPHQTQFTLGTQTVDVANWSGRRRYFVDSTFSASNLVNGQNTLNFTIASTGDRIYFDWFQVTYDRQFLATNGELWFTPKTAGTWRYAIQGLSTGSNAEIYDLTNPLLPKRIGESPQMVDGAGQVSFAAVATTGAKYGVFGAGAVHTFAANTITRTSTDSLKSCANAADYVVVAPANFVSTIQNSNLLSRRAAQGLTTAVVSISDLYDQFSYGIRLPLATKEYLRWFFENGCTKKPSYALLVGDGHWNFKNASGYLDSSTNLLSPNLQYVDPWQGTVDSTTLLGAVSGNDSIPDVYIGRLPISTPAEFETYANKVAIYEDSWNDAVSNQHVFVSDSADGAGNFPEMSDAVIQATVASFWNTVVHKVYVADFCAGNPSDCQPATDDLVNRLNDVGALLVNYTGHATTTGWATESIFDIDDVPFLNNLDKLPVWVSLDCLDGYYHYPDSVNISLAETLVKAANGGAIATFSPGGLGLASGHDVLHQAFYRSILYQPKHNLGQAALAAKLAIFQTGENLDIMYSYTVFGDPALNLHVPNAIFLPLIMR